MGFSQDGTISSLNGQPLKWVEQIIYLGYNISFTEIYINICIGKVRSAVCRLTSL